MTRGTPPPDLSGVRRATPPRSVRDPGDRRGIDVSRLVVILLVGVFILGAAGFVAGALNAQTPRPSASPSTASGASPQPAVVPGAIAAPDHPTSVPSWIYRFPPGTFEPGSSSGPTATPDPTIDPGTDPPASPPPDPSPTPNLVATDSKMPFVPVVGFWSTDNNISRANLVAALKGQGGGYSRVIVQERDRARIADALGIHIADSVESGDAVAIAKAVRKKGTLGVMRASSVPFSVRALGIDGKELFGNDRLNSLDKWPIVATVKATADEKWDQKSTWTLVAGGDSFTDRGIYERVINRHKGIDYPFNGGTVRVTGHYCCGPFVAGHKVPSYVFTGNKGVVRTMVKDADLAIANHESPIPDNWVFHLHGFYFSGKPQLTQIFTRAGIDWFSLANNHIRDYGTGGVMDTLKWLDHYGIKYAGAGRNLKQARKVSYLQTHGVRIGLVSCVMVGKASWATDAIGGGMPCKNKYVLPLIRKAKANADVVIVFPHWGVEYSRSPLNSQRKLAADWVAEGANLILGAHSHVAGAIEEIDGSMVFYSLGNFVFDQNWATYTMESFLLEMTFEGDRLVQIRMHPTLTHDQAQVNLLNPATDDGKAILKGVRRSSSEWLRW
jgi:hypothetical protein